MRIAHYIIEVIPNVHLTSACNLMLWEGLTTHVPSYYDNFSYCRRCIKAIGGARIDKDGNHI